jgi:antitoxin PrlF
MASATVIEEFSTITAKGQTTIPKPVRDALRVHPGDKIAFRVDENGVTVQRADAAREDPAMGSFLAFLARDIERHPENLKALSPDLVQRIAELTKTVVADPDEAIEGDVAL